MESHALVTFVAASVLLTLSPGPDIVYVLTTALLKGFKKAWLVAVGLCSGLIFHTLLVGVGVVQIIQNNLSWIYLLKIFGASYMFYLAYRVFTSSSKIKLVTSENPAIKNYNYFFRGLFMNVVNPKVSLFFLAFLPQFISASKYSYLQQTITLGGIFFVQALFVFTLTAYFSAYLSNKVLKNLRFQKYIQYFQIGLFIVIAIGILLS